MLHAIILIFVSAVHSICIMEHYFIHKHNLILADSRAGVVVKQLAPLEVFTLHTLLLHGAGVLAGGALVTCGSVGTGLGALTGPAHTLAPAAAQQAQVGHAGVSASGAVTVLTLPVWVTLAKATVTDTVA